MNERISRAIVPVVLTAALLFLWRLACGFLPRYILPSPTDAFLTAVLEWRVLLPHVAVTTFECLLGVVISLAVGLPLATAMFVYPPLERALSPFLVASQALPVFALAPLFVVWFGYGVWGKVAMATIIIFFPITVSFLEGLKSCGYEERQLFRQMGAGFRCRFRCLYLPWALPQLFAGLRVGVSVATIGAVIGEWMGAQSGLGYIMVQANARMRTEMLFAAIMWLTAIGLALWYSVGMIERRVLWWKFK